MKLGLGTAQFGLDYGVSNTTGMVSEDQIAEILQFAATHDICYLDTAPAYGNAEQVIGKLLSSNQLQDQFNVMTKFQKLSLTTLLGIQSDFFTSLRKLNSEKIYGVLVHDASDLLSEEGTALYKFICDLKQKGFIEKWGVSVYSPQELITVMDQFDIDLVQLPLNLFDQRFLVDQLLVRLKQNNIEIHVRSVLLQGLLLMELTHLPLHFSPYKTHFEKYNDFLQTNGRSALRAAIGFVSQIDQVDVAVVGVNHLKQLEAIVACSGQPDIKGYGSLATIQSEIIDPRTWNL